jgi:hypothetical protein
MGRVDDGLFEREREKLPLDMIYVVSEISRFGKESGDA